MKRIQCLPELLAPAGDRSALIAAILGGADAIYVGGRRFGARAYAKNFDENELAEAVVLCHLFGVRLYVTVNTLVHDKELADAVEYAKKLHGMGVDAVIIADLGLAAALRREVPDLELHASTQMGIHNSRGADTAYALGCSRVVLARECSARDIKEITEKSRPEIEVFVHGALCVCHSGQCLFSSMVGGRSGNRGECAQPCRLPYNNGKYVLSLKDLSLADHINELIDSGVASLKIEGRMKSASYVYEVTRTYRKLLDEHRGANAVEREHLAAIFSRGGFTDGYFNGKVQGRMTGIRSEADKEATRALDAFDANLPRVALRATASFLKDEPARLSFSCHVTSRWDGIRAEISASVLGDIPAVAENAPLEVKSLGARLAKLGATPFSLSLSDADISLSPSLNLSPGKINELRRTATDALLKKLAVPLDDIIAAKREEVPDAISPVGASIRKPTGITAQFMQPEAYREIKAKMPNALSDIDICYLPLFSLEASDVADGVGAYLPPVIMESEWGEVRDRLATVAAWGVKYALVSNISEISLVRECGLTPVADFRLNVTNKNTYALYASMGCSDISLSPELTVPQARDIGGRVITLGRIPLMITERCFIKDNFGCDKCGKAAITDRMGQRFPMLREWKHRNVIMNSQPTYMGDKKNELLSASLSGHHFILSSESGEEAARLIGSYRGGEKLNTPHRRIGRR